jgi:chromosome segregation ATPase
MSVEDRVLQLENSFRTLTQLAVSASERSDQQLAWINQLGTAQAETETKLAALIDAQVRTEDALAALTVKVDALADKVDTLAGAQIRTEGALAALTVKVDALTDSQSRTDARLDRLAALVEQHITGGGEMQ